MDEVREIWNSHRIRQTKNANVPGGRPVSLFFTHNIYGVENFLIPVSNDDVELYKNECKFVELPCNENMYDLCSIIMEEKHWNQSSNDHWEALDLYLKLRDEVRRLINTE